jgi:MFS family permease
MITYVFADNRERYIGYAESVTGIGCMIGPVLGGFLYVGFGYFWTFFIFGGICLISLVVTLIITPTSINES